MRKHSPIPLSLAWILAGFILYLLMLSLLTGVMWWQTRKMADDVAARQVDFRQREAASLKLYRSLPLNGTGGTKREALEAFLLPRTTVLSARQEPGGPSETLDAVVYRDAAGGEVIVVYHNGQFRGSRPGDIRPRQVVLPAYWAQSLSLQRKVLRNSGWLWIAAFVWLAVSRDRFRRLGRGLVCVAIALTMLAMTLAEGFGGRPDGEYLFWSAVMVVVTLAAMLWPFVRPRRRDPTICQACGYDLRATPDRCPECGTIPTNQIAPGS